jgi:hypothetical protein
MYAHPDFVGCIRIQPALNEAERGFMLDLLDSGRTLRGTPTGRGDADVPFARLAWDACPDGCCLEWDPDLEDARWMAESLRFVIDHLLRPGAKAQGRKGFDGFTFDHVASGAVLGSGHGARTGQLVTVVDNEVTGCSVPVPCDGQPERVPTQHSTVGRPDNVIELRPRRA